MSKFRKILTGFSALALAVALMPMFAAFEAHVINVTAKIENALSVSTKAIDFGTVFPQEHLNKPLAVQLSQSFLEAPRVDDVEYFIRQKPKCGVTNQDGTPEQNGTELVGPTWTGHVVVGDNPFTQSVVETYYIDCDADRPKEVLQLPNPEFWLLPSLCEYISKEDDKTPDNDGSTLSFHKPWQIVASSTAPGGFVIDWLDTLGRLAKSEQDTTDNWIIDLAVPCFGNFCAQDWASFVTGINPTANPDDYTQDIANEHKIFGCDLWVEVSEVSEVAEQVLPQCSDGIDNDGIEGIDSADPGCHIDFDLNLPYDPTLDDESANS